jgi:hypothetical protein
VGINNYPAPHQLDGCVSDARTWGAALERRGFDVRYLTDGEATHERITGELRDLVQRARPGDVAVFQFAGHGTEVGDLDADEEDGTDEALVPADFESGTFLLDDDLRAVLGEVRDGVNLTCFIDCCHSGTSTRILARNAGGPPPGRPRFFRLTPELERAHERFRADQGARGLAPRALAARDDLRWVTFAACAPNEVAYENDGSGDFTRHAMAVLAHARTELTHRSFQARVLDAFGARRRQTPLLDCAPEAEEFPLLAPLAPSAAGGTASAAVKAPAGMGGNGSPGRHREGGVELGAPFLPAR